MAKITASVGIANGKPCYNVPADQQIVQQLLGRILGGQGGQKGKTNWVAPQWGTAATDLYQAILKFQTDNRYTLPYGADGHVDPGGATIRLMNQLADASPSPSPDDQRKPLDSIRFWINAFIPNSVCTKKGSLFVLTVPVPQGTPFPERQFHTGDQREFSDDPSASARMHSEVLIMGLSSDNPRLASQTNVCGETHVVDEDGNIIKRATARNDRMRFFNFRGGQTVDPQGGVIDAYSGSTFTACKPWMATWATLRKTSSASATSTPVARPGRHELESG